MNRDPQRQVIIIRRIVQPATAAVTERSLQGYLDLSIVELALLAAIFQASDVCKVGYQKVSKHIINNECSEQVCEYCISSSW